MGMDKKQKEEYKRIVDELNRLSDECSKLDLKSLDDKLIYKDKLEQVFALEKKKDRIKRPDWTSKQGRKFLRKGYDIVCKDLKKAGKI